MKTILTFLILISRLSVAQNPLLIHRDTKDRLLDRMMFYGTTVEPVTSPDTVMESVRYITFHQENTEGQCNYKLYLFKSNKDQCFFVKKFTVISWEDTVITESPLVELPLRRSMRLDRFFKKASHFITKPYSVYHGSFDVTKNDPKVVERKNYWRIEVRQGPPYKPFLNRWHQANPYNKDPVNTGLMYILRQKIATRSLRRILREYSSCP